MSTSRRRTGVGALAATIALVVAAPASTLADDETAEAAPVPVDDSYNTTQNEVLVVADPGVLSNDLNVPDGSTVIFGSPQHGDLAAQSTSGGFTYTPDPGFAGTDTVLYGICPPGCAVPDPATGDGTVTIVVSPTPPPPPPMPPRAIDDDYSTGFDGTITVRVPGVLTNDERVPNDGEAKLLTPPTHGSGTLQLDGGLVYRAESGFTGTDSFTYCIQSGQSPAVGCISNEATVTITVPTRPDPVANDDDYTVPGNGTLDVPAPSVLANDSDVPDERHIQVLDGPFHQQAFSLLDESLHYLPDPGFVGTDTFTYCIMIPGRSGCASNSATATIDVVNNPPVAADDEYSTPAGVQLCVDPPGHLANDSDADGDELQPILVDGPENGHVIWGIDATAGFFCYTPNDGFSGVDSFTYQVEDSHGALSNVATITIVVIPNERPVAVDDFYTTSSDTELVIEAPGVLANDTDADDDELEVSLVGAADPERGDVTFFGDTPGGFRYTPDPGFIGTDTLTYFAVDNHGASSNEATVTIEVEAVPQPTVVTLTASPAPATVGDEVVLTATVTPVDPASGEPTGSVEFFADGQPLGSDILESPATLVVEGLDPGTYELTARYEGDAEFVGATSDPVTLTVHEHRTDGPDEPEDPGGPGDDEVDPGDDEVDPDDGISRPGDDEPGDDQHRPQGPGPGPGPAPSGVSNPGGSAAAPPTRPLPRTGTSTGTGIELIVIGLGLAILGGALVLCGRRRTA